MDTTDSQRQQETYTYLQEVDTVYGRMKPDEQRNFIQGLQDLIGEQWVETDPCILDTYAWQMNAELIGDTSHFMPRAVAVVLPETTEEVSAVMKHCHSHGIQCKPMGSGQGPWNAPRRERNSVQVDLRRMDRLLKIDEKNMYAVVETYVTNNMLQTEAMKVGLTCHIIGAGGQASQLAAATSFNGHGLDGMAFGFAGRNLLGFEWVLPDGEIVRVGSFDSSGEMFMGDGPGPSIRGIIRGFAGAMGGLGIFTKAAVKLYPWHGPKKLEVFGKNPNLMFKIPPNHMVTTIGVPGWKEVADLGYGLTEAEIGEIAFRNAPVITIPALYSCGADAIKALKNPMFRALDRIMYCCFFARHREEHLYQQRVISELAKSLEGGILGSDGGLTGLLNKLRFIRLLARRIGVLKLLRSVPGFSNLLTTQFGYHGLKILETGNPMDCLLYGKFVKNDSNVKVTVVLGGNFSTSLGTICPWDLAVRSAQVGTAIKRSFIKSREIIDDGGDGGHGGLYEGGSYSHIETVALYDPNDKRQIEAQDRFIAETNQASIRESLGISINSFGPAGSDTFSRHAMNYDELLQAIKREYDPENTADAGWYTDPEYKTPEREKKLRREADRNCPSFDGVAVSERSAAHLDIPWDWLEKRQYRLMEEPAKS